MPCSLSLGSLRYSLVVVALAIATTRVAEAQTKSDAIARAAVVAPFVESQTLIAARIDLRKIDPMAAAKMLAELAPKDDTEFPKQIAMIEQQAKQILHGLTTAGMSELYIVGSLADLAPNGPPLFVVAPVKTGSDPQQASHVLREALSLPARDVRDRVAIAGSQATIERLKTLQAAPRGEFAKGFERAGDGAMQIVFAPSDDTRRVFREMLSRLPDEVGGGSGKMLADGVQWAAISVQAPPQLSLSVVIQSKDADSAAAVRGLIVSALQLVGKQKEVRERWAQFDDLARLITPRLAGDQLILNLSDQGGTAQELVKLLAFPVQAARTAAGRAQSTNNLRQIGLAMHNFHDTHGHFPPQAIRSKEGKPLLSWRVAILPFVEQDHLYKQFHLDEPWDSEHNKKLIEKMSPVFASPALGNALRAKGMTSYLVPLSNPPPAVAVPPKADSKQVVDDSKVQMVFDVSQGTKIRQITDGTSNTIMVLEANPKAAVIWTKPDDLVMDENDLFKNLRGQPGDGAYSVFCDGSARLLKSTIDPKTFLHLLQMNDGQPIGDY